METLELGHRYGRLSPLAAINTQRRYIIAIETDDHAQARVGHRPLRNRRRSGRLLHGGPGAGGWLHQVRLVQLAQQGDIERVSRGVYRFTRFPVSKLGHYMEAVLWPQVRRPDVAGAISHQSALSIHELSDVSPARVHLTLPTTVRIRREVPKGLVIHYADLAPADVERVEGVTVTTPARSIRDAHASHVGNELVGQAIADGRRSGSLSIAEADRLERELLGTTPRRRRSTPSRMDRR